MPTSVFGFCPDSSVGCAVPGAWAGRTKEWDGCAAVGLRCPCQQGQGAAGIEYFWPVHRGAGTFQWMQ